MLPDDDSRQIDQRRANGKNINRVLHPNQSRPRCLVCESTYTRSRPLCDDQTVSREEMRAGAHETSTVRRKFIHKCIPIISTSNLITLTPTPSFLQTASSASYFEPPNHPEKPDFMALVASSLALSSSAASSFNHFSPFSRISFSSAS